MAIRCGCCGTAVYQAAKCHSCASAACTMCMAAGEAWCLGCQEDFPVAPPSHFSVQYLALEFQAVLHELMPSEGAPISLFAAPQAGFTALKRGEVLHQRPERMHGVLTDSVIRDVEQNSADAYPSDGSEETMDWNARGFGHVANPFDHEPVEPMSNATTMMLRNLPNRLPPGSLTDAIDAMGFAGTYEFVHMPRRVRQDSYLGYAFVNFFNAKDAAKFCDAFEGYSFAGTRSKKKCVVTAANLQGFVPKCRRR